jgi:hypothetical protein
MLFSKNINKNRTESVYSQIDYFDAILMETIMGEDEMVL